jgi:radical SAM superfamily enzyme YgiQ (UPF0313 family)
MKVLFLEIDTEKSWALASVGPAVMAATLRQAGHEAGLLRIPPEQSTQQIVNRVGQAGPDLIGLSLTTHQWPRAARVVGALRREMGTPVVAGGLHPTFVPEAVLAAEGFDYVCLGEGEEAICELATALERGDDVSANSIANIWARGAERPALLPPVDLDRLPSMARDLLDEQHGVFHMLTGRGCPFPCTYCSAGSLGALYQGQEHSRRRSVEGVIQELEAIHQQTPINYVIFLDDTFTLSPQWLEAFCGAYGRRVAAGFSIHARIETVTRAVLAQLAEAGCRHVVYGVESGSPRVRREIMRRTGDNQKIVDAFAWAREQGMMVTANYMIGLPGETGEEIEQTLALNDELAPDDFSCFVFHPYPGTQLFELCQERGYLPDDWLARPADNRRSILTLPGLGQDDIEAYYTRFTEAREQAYLRRYGRAFTEADKEIVSRIFREDAAKE